MLGLCPSAPHRAVLGLMAVALGRPCPASLQNDLASSAPEQIAAIANQGHAQTILHSAFVRQPELSSALPHDLLIYFAEMQRANADRNQQAVAQMREIAGILAPHQIPVMALKGAADVLDPLHDTPAHRYISDLDLLVPADRAVKAAGLLRAEWGLPDEGQDAGPHHHLPQIISSAHLFTVELHVRPGSDIVAQVLDAGEMFAQAERVEGMLIPCPQDRLLHHVLHGMELRHETATLNLRLLADHVQYRLRMPQETRSQALTRLDAASLGDWLRDLDRLADAMLGQEPSGWAAQALIRFGDPQAAMRRDTLFWARHYLRRLGASATYRRQIMRKVFSPAAWAEFFHFHRERRGRFK